MYTNFEYTPTNKISAVYVKKLYVCIFRNKNIKH